MYIFMISSLVRLKFHERQALKSYFLLHCLISPAYTFEYELTVPTPPKMCLTFHETRLDQFDVQKLETEAVDDESYQPIPQLYSFGAQRVPTLEYNPHD